MSVRRAAEICSATLLDTVPHLMQAIRKEMRRQRGVGVSIAQLRTLAYLRRAPGACLAEISVHLGVSHPTASVLVERLVHREMIARGRDPGERRRVVLHLTPSGARRLSRAGRLTRAHLAVILAELSPAALEQISEALLTVRRALDNLPDRATEQTAAPPTARAAGRGSARRGCQLRPGKS